MTLNSVPTFFEQLCPLTPFPEYFMVWYYHQFSWSPRYRAEGQQLVLAEEGPGAGFE